VLAERGFGAGADATVAENTTTFSASAGYVALPWLEAGLVASRASTSQQQVERVQRSIGPYVTVFPLRQGPDAHVGLYATASASVGDRSGDLADLIERQGGSVSSRSGSVGVGAFRAIRLSGRSRVVPAVELAYARLTQQSTLDGETESTTAGTTALTIEARFVVEPSSLPRISVTPRASVGDVVSGGLSAAVLLGGR
jgi:hypothetical protein